MITTKNNNKKKKSPRILIIRVDLASQTPSRETRLGLGYTTSHEDPTPRPWRSRPCSTELTKTAQTDPSWVTTKNPKQPKDNQQLVTKNPTPKSNTLVNITTRSKLIKEKPQGSNQHQAVSYGSRFTRPNKNMDTRIPNEHFY